MWFPAWCLLYINVHYNVHSAAPRQRANGIGLDRRFRGSRSYPAAIQIDANGRAKMPNRHAAIRKATTHGLTNFSTNSSLGWGGSGVFLSRGSEGLRRKLPWAASLKPADSTSWRRNASSIRCSVPDSEIP